MTASLSWVFAAVAGVASCTAPAGDRAAVAPPTTAAPTPPGPVPSTLDLASPGGVDALASGQYDLTSVIEPRAGVIDVVGAATPTSRGRCGRDAAAAVEALARRIVERARAGGASVACDLRFVDAPDPIFGALPAGTDHGAWPGRPYRYAVCVSPGRDPSDRPYAIYFAPR